jgi:TRAP-type C4-dicarboxylate transport system permease small subunit
MTFAPLDLQGGEDDAKNRRGLLHLLKIAITLCLAVMVVLVFDNVVLRYGFNLGITVSEEISRWLFVWLTFLGAIVAMREHGHLGGGHAGQAAARKRFMLLLIVLFPPLVMVPAKWFAG